MVLVVARSASSRCPKVPRPTSKSFKVQWQMPAAAVEGVRGARHLRHHHPHDLAQPTFPPRPHLQLGLRARPRPRPQTRGITLPPPSTPPQRIPHQARQSARLGHQPHHQHPGGRHLLTVTRFSTRTRRRLGRLLLLLCRHKGRRRLMRQRRQLRHIPEVLQV